MRSGARLRAILLLAIAALGATACLGSDDNSPPSMDAAQLSGTMTYLGGTAGPNGASSPAVGLTVLLHSADGLLAATAITDGLGHWHVETGPGSYTITFGSGSCGSRSVNLSAGPNPSLDKACQAP
jgi:hypothetical protein